RSPVQAKRSVMSSARQLATKQVIVNSFDRPAPPKSRASLSGRRPSPRNSPPSFAQPSLNHLTTNRRSGRMATTSPTARATAPTTMAAPFTSGVSNVPPGDWPAHRMNTANSTPCMTPLAALGAPAAPPHVRPPPLQVPHAPGHPPGVHRGEAVEERLGEHDQARPGERQRSQHRPHQAEGTGRVGEEGEDHGGRQPGPVGLPQGLGDVVPVADEGEDHEDQEDEAEGADQRADADPFELEQLDLLRPGLGLG